MLAHETGPHIRKLLTVVIDDGLVGVERGEGGGTTMEEDSATSTVSDTLGITMVMEEGMEGGTEGGMEVLITIEGVVALGDSVGEGVAVMLGRVSLEEGVTETLRKSVMVMFTSTMKLEVAFESGAEVELMLG